MAVMVVLVQSVVANTIKRVSGASLLSMFCGWFKAAAVAGPGFNAWQESADKPWNWNTFVRATEKRENAEAAEIAAMQ